MVVVVVMVDANVLWEHAPCAYWVNVITFSAQPKYTGSITKNTFLFIRTMLSLLSPTDHHSHLTPPCCYCERAACLLHYSYLPGQAPSSSPPQLQVTIFLITQCAQPGAMLTTISLTGIHRHAVTIDNTTLGHFCLPFL